MPAQGHFITNETEGFQLSTGTLDALQKNWKDVELAFSKFVGNHVAIYSSITPNPPSFATINELIITHNNEIYVVEGLPVNISTIPIPTPPPLYVEITEEVTQLKYCSGNTHDAYTVRKAELTDTPTMGSDNFLFSELVYLNYAEIVDTLNTNIANVLALVTTNTTNITNLETVVDSQLKHLTMDIGGWNMTTTAIILKAIPVAITDVTKIVGVSAIIFHDQDGGTPQILNYDFISHGGKIRIDYVPSPPAASVVKNFVLDAGKSTYFNQTTFNNTGVNRGKLLVWYTA